MLGLAFDGGGGVGWTTAPLLNRTANLSVQPIQLWRKTGAALIPGVVVRAPGELVQEQADVGDDAPGLVAAAIGQLDAGVPEDLAHRHAVAAAQHQHALRRAMRGQDVRPFFEGWPTAEGALSAGEAERRLRAAGERT